MMLQLKDRLSLKQSELAHESDSKRKEVLRKEVIRIQLAIKIEELQQRIDKLK